MRRIKVFWNKDNSKIEVGELAQKNTPEIVFEWNREFLNNNIELSPVRFQKKEGLIKCPLTPFDGLPGFIADCVPDGWGRVLLRHILRKDGLSLQELSPLDMLSYIGDRAMGALSFEPTLRPKEKWGNGVLDLDKLNDEVPKIIEDSPSAVIEQYLQSGSSPNGMRPKIIATEKNNKFIVGSNEPNLNEWLIKFRAEGDSKDIGKIEYIYSLIAKKSGIDIPETKLIETKQGSFFAVKLFDRDNKTRLHMHTLSGILHISPNNFTISYENFAQVTNLLTRNIKELEKVFRIAVFNILSVNRDDHAKNVSFLMDSNGNWKVAPAYDLTFFEGQFKEHKMTLNSKGNPSIDDLKMFSKNIGLNSKKALEIIECTKEELSKFRLLSKKYEISKLEANRIEKEIYLKLTDG
jgi:serine/threonine-protein kinase HipA